MNAQEREWIAKAEREAARNVGWTAQAFLRGTADRGALRTAVDRWLKSREELSKLAFTKVGAE